MKISEVSRPCSRAAIRSLSAVGVVALGLSSAVPAYAQQVIAGGRGQASGAGTGSAATPAVSAPSSNGLPATAEQLLKMAEKALAGNPPTTTTRPAASPKSGKDTPGSQASVTQVRPMLLQRPADTDHPPFERGGNFSTDGLNESATHITVGRSLFVDTRHRIARIYITDPDVIDSYTASPNEIVITAKKTGSTTLILWDESGESKSYIVSSDLNVETLRQSLKEALPDQTIKVIGDGSKVVLMGTVGSKEISDQAVKIASVYSKEVSNSMQINTAKVKQVRLEVKVVEADRSKLAQFGFNFFSTGGQNPASTTTGQYASTMAANIQNGVKTLTTTNPLNFSLYINKLNIGATLQDLETMQVLQILAEPNLSVMSGEKANFLAGGEFPFPVIQSSSTGTPVVSLMFKQYGVKLEFLPVVNQDGTIDLKVAPEVSALDYTNSVTIAGYTIPAISTRRAETEVVLKSGQTFALAGLLDKRTTDLYSKTPGAASIPVLGQLFKSKNITHSDTELVVIITPILVDPVNEPLPVYEKPVPVQTVPFMDTQKFDKDLPSGAKKQ